MSSGKSALIIGATGATGKHLLTELLGSSIFTRVGEYGRRCTPLESISGGKEKLEQKTIDFEKLEEAGLKEGKWDVVFITLGTKRATAGSAAAFEKIDREYVVNAARQAALNDPSHPQRVVYLSSTGADATSYFLYPRSKGLTEIELSKLGYSDTLIFRPALLADRGDGRFIERVAENFLSISTSLTNKYSAPTSMVAKAMRIAGELGSSKLPAAAKATKGGDDSSPFTIIDNLGVRGIAEEK